MKEITRCYYCNTFVGKEAEEQIGFSSILETDHFVPISKGGTEDPGNLVASCRKCNRMKAGKEASEWENDLLGDAYMSVHRLSWLLTSELASSISNLLDAAVMKEFPHEPITYLEEITNNFYEPD